MVLQNYETKIPVTLFVFLCHFYDAVVLVRKLSEYRILFVPASKFESASLQPKNFCFPRDCCSDRQLTQAMYFGKTQNFSSLALLVCHCQPLVGSLVCIPERGSDEL